MDRMMEFIGEMNNPSPVTEVALYYLCTDLEIKAPVTTALVQSTSAAMQDYSTPSPTAYQVATIYFHNMSCQCLRDLDPGSILTACDHMISAFRRSPSCRMIREMIMFHMIEGNWPSYQELGQFITNSMDMNADAEAYCESKKMLVPTPNLDHLVPCENQEEDRHCSICQDAIELQDQIFKLPCRHFFHADCRDCLGDRMSIMAWLTKCKRCPNCNLEIKICRRRQIILAQISESKNDAEF
jgi:hypothetical protein